MKTNVNFFFQEESLSSSASHSTAANHNKDEIVRFTILHCSAENYAPLPKYGDSGTVGSHQSQ